MSIPTPFTTNFPLNIAPFASRVESQLDANKNYYLVAFKPGFPLQASELNEMQEIFYMQQTLTQTMFANWGIKQYSEQSGAAMTETPWNGCTPLSPDLISINSDSTNITVTCKAGWYLLKSPNYNGGFGVWVYMSSDVERLTGFTPASSSSFTGNYGIQATRQTVNCTKSSSPNPQTEDRTLQDSSNINVINGPCGAARLQMSNLSFAKEQTGTEFYPMFTATANGTVASVTFKNGYIIKQVS
jgi:hypothetical protein